MKLTELTDKDCIHVKNEKEAKKIAKMFKEAGYKHVNTFFGGLNTPNVIYLNESYLTWSSAKDAKKIGCNIIPASKFIKKEKKCKCQCRMENIKVNDAETVKVVGDELNELPEKWCILITEENKTIIEKGVNWSNKIDVYGYYYSERFISGVKKESYTEITIEQFKKWVLKEEAIDWSKAGQLLISDIGNIVITHGEHTDEIFSGTVVLSTCNNLGMYGDKLIKEYFKPFKGEIILKN